MTGALGLFVLVVAACGTGTQAEPTQEPTRTASSPSPSTEPEPEVDADEAAILSVYEAYWDASVEAQRGNPDPALFEGIARGTLVEEDIAEARMFQQYEIVREGEPGFSEVSVTVDGDVARVSACVDYSTWVVPEAEDDRTIADVLPVTAVVERIDDRWLVTDFVPSSHTC